LPQNCILYADAHTLYVLGREYSELYEHPFSVFPPKV
jgi:hypothetical protein